MLGAFCEPTCEPAIVLVFKRLATGDGQHESDRLAIEFGHLFQIAHGKEGRKTFRIERAGDLLGHPVHGEHVCFIGRRHVTEGGM